MGSHKKAYKDRRRFTHPRPDNKVLAKRKRDRKKAQRETKYWVFDTMTSLALEMRNESR